MTSSDDNGLPSPTPLRHRLVLCGLWVAGCAFLYGLTLAVRNEQFSNVSASILRFFAGGPTVLLILVVERVVRFPWAEPVITLLFSVQWLALASWGAASALRQGKLPWAACVLILLVTGLLAYGLLCFQ